MKLAIVFVVSMSLLAMAVGSAMGDDSCDSSTCEQPDVLTAALEVHDDNIALQKKASINRHPGEKKKHSPRANERHFIEKWANLAKAELKPFGRGHEAYLLVGRSKHPKQAEELYHNLTVGMQHRLLRHHKTTTKDECTSNQYWGCETEVDCEGVEGQWVVNEDWGDYCTSQCNADNYWSCYSSCDCQGVGKQWVVNGMMGDYCTEQCTSDNYWACQTEAECTGLGSFWVATSGEYCTNVEPPACDSDNYWYCGEEDCEGIGYQWVEADWGDYCTFQCSLENYWACFTEAECSGCEGIGMQWVVNEDWGNYCATQCSADNYWSCYTEAECTAVEHAWTEADWGAYCEHP